MRFDCFRVALLALAAGACEESSMEGVAGLSGDSAHIANEFSAADRRRVTEALLASADTGHCQVLHLFGSPNWVETGLCVASNGTQCQTGHPNACFNGRTDLNAVVATRCGYTVNLTSSCTVSGAVSGSGRIAFVSNRAGNNEIYVRKADSSGVTRLTRNSANDGQPAWSPDGTKLAFVTDRDSDDEIYVMNAADGSGLKRLTDDTAAIERAPAWSPDGSKIAFASNRSGHFEIYVMSPSGSGVTRLTTNLPFQGCGGTSRGAEDAPAWSPDGSKIAFLHKKNCFGKDIDVMNANGSGLTKLIDAGLAAKLAWGRTGKIAFDPRVIPGEGYSDAEIEVVTVNGATVTRLTNNTANDFSPTWSLDGSTLAFASDRDGDADIYKMTADGKNVTRLTGNSVFDGEPAWGP